MRRRLAWLASVPLVRGLSAAAPIKPVKFLALRYKYVEDILERRGPFRAAHIAGLQRMADEGKCLLGGAFNDPADGAVVFFDADKCSKRDVEDFANVRLSLTLPHSLQADPYVTNDLVPEWSVSEYMAVVGTLKPDQ